MLDPVTRSGTVTIPLRWEATGLTGRLFPVLDADLVLEHGEGETTRLGLTGAYRPPLGNVGAAIDQVILHHAATATVRSLLKQVAEALTQLADTDAAGMDAAGMDAAGMDAAGMDAAGMDARGESPGAASR